MKTKLIIISILLMTASMTAQTFGTGQLCNDYIYLKTSFDPNQAFGLMDNPRTEVESYGLDYDIELGARWKSIGVYIYYGRFNEIGYQNYGAGLDVYINWFSQSELVLYNPFTGNDATVIQGVDLSLGANNGLVMREFYGYNNNPKWGAFMAFAVRATVTFWFSDTIGGVLTAQGQNRPDIGKFMIFEGGAGLVFRRKNNPIRR